MHLTRITNRLLVHQVYDTSVAYVYLDVYVAAYLVVSAQDVYAVRDLSVYHGSVSVLPTSPAALAELHPTQSIIQRLFRQSVAVG